MIDLSVKCDAFVVHLNLHPSLPAPVPRNQDRNTVLDVDFDIELGNTADEAKDDPGKTTALTRLRWNGGQMCSDRPCDGGRHMTSGRVRLSNAPPALLTPSCASVCLLLVCDND